MKKTYDRKGFKQKLLSKRKTVATVIRLLIVLLLGCPLLARAGTRDSTDVYKRQGDILVQKAPACTIQVQAEAVCELFGGKKEDIKVIGIRHGEKMYETCLLYTSRCV